MSNEIISVPDSANPMINSFTTGAMTYSSIKTESFDDKIAVLTAMSEAKPISESLGKTFGLKDFIVQPVELQSETGQMVNALRTVMVADTGECYASVSDIIVRRLRDIVCVLGAPSEWERPLQVRVDRLKGNGANFFYDLVITSKPKK